MNRELRKARLERAQEDAKARRDASLARSRARMEMSRKRQANIRARNRQRNVALVDLVDKLLDGGVVIHGDITLAVADVDLLYVGLRALVSSVETIEQKTGVSLTARGPTLDRSAL